jgi:GT2 family glycosyltransferase
MGGESVDFCILSYNRLEDLKVCLAAVEQARLEAESRVIVVDNGSSDGSREYLQQYVDEHRFCTFVSSQRNVGVGAGRNTAYRLSTSDIIISLDDDSRPMPDIVARTREAFWRFREAGVIAYRIVHPRTHEVQNECGPQAAEVGAFHGAGYAVHRRALSRAGLLDEECRFGAEEFEYSIRLRRSGATVTYVPDIIVLHNSRQRIAEHWEKTAIQWCYNFTRVLFKYFPAHVAVLHTSRLYGKEIAFGWRRGLRLWALIMRGLYIGAAAGLADRAHVTAEVLRFYTSPSTLPDAGNVRFRTKIAMKLFKVIG